MSIIHGQVAYFHWKIWFLKEHTRENKVKVEVKRIIKSDVKGY